MVTVNGLQLEEHGLAPEKGDLASKERDPVVVSNGLALEAESLA